MRKSKRIKNNKVKQYRRLSGVAFDIFQFEFSSVSAFVVDSFRTFVESVCAITQIRTILLSKKASTIHYTQNGIRNIQQLR